MKIHALPGMGADHTIYPGHWTKLPGFTAHDWPAYHGELSLAEVARSVAAAFDIADGDVVVGASLGGMVGCEIAAIRNLKALVLVGSAVSPREIHPVLARSRSLARVAPFRIFQAVASTMPIELLRMFARTDAAFIRAMCSAVFRWPGLVNARVRCIRIHGRRDRVIPSPAHVDHWIDCGHLPSYTHPADCIRFLESVL